MYPTTSPDLPEIRYLHPGLLTDSRRTDVWVESFRKDYPASPNTQGHSAPAMGWKFPNAIHLPSGPLNKQQSIPSGIFAPVSRLLLPIVVVDTLPAPDCSPVLPCGSAFGDLTERGSIHHFGELCRKVMKEKKGVPAPPRCTHLLARPFTFPRTDQTIKMCPDCTRYDTHRRSVLKQGQVDKLTPAQEAICNHVLAEEGLSMERLKKMLCSNYWLEGFPITAMSLCNGYELCAKCGLLLGNGERVDCIESRRLYSHPKCRPVTSSNHPLTYMGTISHLADAEEGAANISGGRVNTAGNFDTEHEGTAKDSCIRDWRGKAIFQREQEHTHHVKSVCLWCGEEIWSKEGTDYCPGTNHRQMLFKEKDALMVEIYLLTKKWKLIKTQGGN